MQTKQRYNLQTTKLESLQLTTPAAMYTKIDIFKYCCLEFKLLKFI
jgi:hypothetical protein